MKEWLVKLPAYIYFASYTLVQIKRHQIFSVHIECCSYELIIMYNLDICNFDFGDTFFVPIVAKIMGLLLNYFSTDKLTMDHVIPKSRSGKNTWERVPFT